MGSVSPMHSGSCIARLVGVDWQGSLPGSSVLSESEQGLCLCILEGWGLKGFRAI